MKKIIAFLFFVIPSLVNANELNVVAQEVVNAVHEFHINKQNHEEIGISFLQSIQKIDEKIKILQNKKMITLSYQGVLVGRYKKPQNITEWGKIIEKSVNQLKKHSYFLSIMEQEKIIEIMVGELLNGLDKYSYYNSKAISSDLIAMRSEPQVSITSETYGIKPEKTAGKGYLTLVISDFDEKTPVMVEAAIKQYYEQTKSNLKGIVVDLRNNKGGSLQQAVKTADLFLDRVKITSVKGRSEESFQDYYATPKQIAIGVPIIIFVNSITASSAELFASALIENNRAKIFGENTHGKSSVQTGISLSNGGEIVLTWAKFLTPKGDDIQGFGITPPELIP